MGGKNLLQQNHLENFHICAYLPEYNLLTENTIILQSFLFPRVSLEDFLVEPGIVQCFEIKQPILSLRQVG